MEPGLVLYSLLSQAPAVTALLGTRIYPVRAAQGAPRPYIVYQLVSNVPEGGPLCDMGDVARVQVSIFSDDYKTQAGIAKAVKGVLNGAETGGAFLEIENQQDFFEDQAACLHRTQDYRVELPAD